MENKIVKLKCPYCGEVLRILYASGVEKKNVRCPVCKHTHPYVAYRIVSSWKDEEKEERTHYEEKARGTFVGKLVMRDDGRVYALKDGVNIIGRKSANNAEANVQIETEDRYMSRNHAQIEKIGDAFYFGITKAKNDTVINGVTIQPGDKVELLGGEIIKLANTELCFKLEDEESTKI